MLKQLTKIIKDRAANKKAEKLSETFKAYSLELTNRFNVLADTIQNLPAIIEYNEDGEAYEGSYDPVGEALISSAQETNQDLRAKVSGIIGLAEHRILNPSINQDDNNQENKKPTVGSQLITAQKNLMGIFALAKHHQEYGSKYDASTISNSAEHVNMMLDQLNRMVNKFGLQNIEVPPSLIINRQNSPTNPSGGSGGGGTVIELRRD